MLVLTPPVYVGSFQGWEQHNLTDSSNKPFMVCLPGGFSLDNSHRSPGVYSFSDTHRDRFLIDTTKAHHNIDAHLLTAMKKDKRLYRKHHYVPPWAIIPNYTPQWTLIKHYGNVALLSVGPVKDKITASAVIFTHSAKHPIEIDLITRNQDKSQIRQTLQTVVTWLFSK